MLYRAMVFSRTLDGLQIYKHNLSREVGARCRNPARPFMTMLNLPDLSKLMNDPVSHDPTWPPVPTKLPSDILKFEGKNGEDPSDHVTSFHLWSSSNSLNDDSICLRLFQCTLIEVAAKWYIELPRGHMGLLVSW
jgi:hypothetical protein